MTIPHEYTVASRTERFRSHIFRVVTDEVAMPGGLVAARDCVIHIGSVGVVALDDTDRVVLVRQYRHPVGHELWELPAGLIDVAGEDLVDAARRELAEEADLRAEHWDLLADVHTSPGYSNELIRIFLARGLSPVAEDEHHQRTHEEADMTTRAVAIDEAVRMALAGEITNAACVVGVLAAAHARSQGWPALRPVDSPRPNAAPASAIAQPPALSVGATVDQDQHAVDDRP